MSAATESTALVTVACIAYNHEATIAQALDGFVMQQTDFPFQVLVGDDCSTDGTAAIVREYAERHPDIIKPVIREQNLGAQRNLIDLCDRAGSTYMAFCEGDDYWTDPLKLQKQVDYMEAHPEFRSCFHDVRVSVETKDGSWIIAEDFSHTPDGVPCWPSGNRDFKSKERYHLTDFVNFGLVHTSSMFFRWNRNLEIPEWYYNHLIGDYTIWALQLGQGECGYIPDCMSVYRIWSGGVYQYKTRYELWDATKSDWLAIDRDMFAYFTEVVPDTAIAAEVLKRMDMDMRELMRAKFALHSADDVVQAARDNADIAKAVFGIDMDKYEGRDGSDSALMRKLQTAFEIRASEAKVSPALAGITWFTKKGMARAKRKLGR